MTLLALTSWCAAQAATMREKRRPYPVACTDMVGIKNHDALTMRSGYGLKLST